MLEHVTPITTYDIMYSEMQMDYRWSHSGLQDIKWLELHDNAVGSTSSRETVEISIGTDLEWYSVVIVLTGIVIILSLETISVVFEFCYYHQCHYYFVMNIIIIKIDIIIIIIIVIVSIIVSFRTYTNALYYFLLNLEWSDWPPPQMYEQSYWSVKCFSTYLILSGGSYDSGTHVP